MTIRPIFLIYMALTVASLYPIFSVLVLPLADYPSHLARSYIVDAWDLSLEIQQNYAVDFSIKPNMAIDLLMLPLLRIFPIYDAGRIAASFSLLAIVLGTMMLRKALYGKVGIWPILSYLIVYNYIFFWGFLEYLLTSGLALIAFSLWITLRDRSSILRIMIFSLMSFGLYVGHILGLFIYSLMVVGYEGWLTKNRFSTISESIKDWSLLLIQFMVPGVLFLMWIEKNSSTTNTITSFGNFQTKALAFYSPVNFGLFYIDLATALYLWVVFVFCRREKRVGFSQEIKYPLLLIFIATLFIPNYLAGVWGVDFRFSPIMGCLILSGIDQRGNIGRRMKVILASAIPLIFLKVTIIGNHWQDFDRDVREFRDAVRSLRPGASVLVVLDSGESVPKNKTIFDMPAYLHIDALSVIERATFNPTLATGIFTVDASNLRQPIDTPVGAPITRKMLVESADQEVHPYPLENQSSRYMRAYWVGWAKNFDYVLSLRFENPINPYPSRLEKIKSGSFFDLLRVVRDVPGNRGIDGENP